MSAAVRLVGARAWTAVAAVNLLLLPWLFYGLQSDDTDTFYHLAAGRHMAEHGGVLDREASSFTIPGRPWTNYSWLFQRLLYAAHRVAGVPGVLGVRSLFLLAVVNLLFVLLWRRSGGSPLITFVLTLLGVGLIGVRALQVRPHLASYACLVALLLVLDRRWPRPWPAAAAVFALCAGWANLHGVGYPVGLAVLALSAATTLADAASGRRVAADARGAALALAAGAAGFLANPFGWRLLSSAAVAMDAEAMSQIGEMGRLPLAALASLSANLELRSMTLASAVVLGGLLLAPTWLRHRAWSALGTYALGLGLLLFRGRRMVPELAILALPAVAEGLALRFARPAPGARRMLHALGAYLVVAAAVTTWRDARGGLFERLSDRLPHGPVALLEQLDFRGHVLADATHAGYVSWRVPRARIFMDMRMPEPFSAHEAWLYKRAGEEVSLASLHRRYGLHAVLVRLESPLARRLRAAPGEGFGVAYADHAWALFLPESVLSARPDLRVSFLRELEAIADGGAPASSAATEPLTREVDRLIAIWPGNHLAQRAWLWLRTHGGQPREAATAARVLAARYPRLPAYPYAEGLAWAAAGEAEPAARAFGRAVRVDPGYEPAYPALARALAALGRTDAALDALERFHELRRYRLDAADTVLLARLRRREGRLAAAADAYRRALWLLPEGDAERGMLESELAEIPQGR